MKLSAATALLITLMTTVPCQATQPIIRIDSFVTPQEVAVSGNGFLGLPVSADSFASGPSLLGAERDISMTANPASFLNGIDIDTRVLRYSAGVALSPGTSILVYDGPDGSAALDPTGLGGFDLTMGGALQFLTIDVLSKDSEPVDLEVLVYSDATHISRTVFSFPDPISSKTRFSAKYGDPMDFTDIGAMGGADFTSVGAISVEILGGAAQFHLSELASRTTPEPSTGLISALLLGWAARRRRKARRAA